MRKPVVVLCGVMVMFFCCSVTVRADELADLKEIVQKQQAQLERQGELINALTQKVQTMETQRQAVSAGKAQKVSLDYQETTLAAEAGAGQHIMEKEWFRRVDLTGFGAAGFLWTGADAARPDGSFLNYEASLFLEADVWDQISFFSEIQSLRLGDENNKFVRIAELYAHFKNILKHKGDDLLGIKAGRMDIPFGEEYLAQDSIDNPLISWSVNWPYGWDEGLLLYGKLGKLGWVASLMDGNDTRGTDDDLDKSLNLKFYGNPAKPLYLSVSAMRNGKSAKSALEFAGSHIEPVGRGDGAGAAINAQGVSPSVKVDSYLYELDAKYQFGKKGYLWANFGQAFVEDESALFDRDFLYFTLQPLYNLTDKWYLVYRFSGIGTFNNKKGYHFDGKPWAGGNGDFGYDTKSLLRHAIGLGFRLNPRTIIKLEYSRDNFDVIDASSRNDHNEDRDLIGTQVVVKF